MDCKGQKSVKHCISVDYGDAEFSVIWASSHRLTNPKDWFLSLIRLYLNFHLSLAYLHIAVYKISNGMNSPAHYWGTLSKGRGETKPWSSKQLLDCSLALTVTSVIQLNNSNSCWNYVETNMVQQISLGGLSLLAFTSLEMLLSH